MALPSLSETEENADIFDFELNKEQMDTLNGLDKGAAGACSWNPVDAEWNVSSWQSLRKRVAI